MADPNIQKVAQKIKNLRTVYLSADDQARITDTEEALRRNIKQMKLAERPEVKQVIDQAAKAIKDIDFLLANDDTLTTEQRMGLFAEKKVHKFWLQRLDGERAKQAIEIIDEGVDSLLEAKQ